MVCGYDSRNKVLLGPIGHNEAQTTASVVSASRLCRIRPMRPKGVENKIMFSVHEMVNAPTCTK